MNNKFGTYGGCYVPELLVPAVKELRKLFRNASGNPEFESKRKKLLRNHAGRPTPLYHAKRMSETLDMTVYLKREDLLHTGAHKLNNTLGQALLAKEAGKERIIAETGAGQHGVATAAACARMNLDCEIYMGEKDVNRQKPNVHRMKLLGANVIPVDSGSRTLKDAINEALRDWVSNLETTHYLLGSVLGPTPYPEMVATFQSVIGREAKEQIRERTGRLPDRAVACVGGGSNAIGLFRGFMDEDDVDLVGVEAGGEGIQTGRHAARFSGNSHDAPGVFHGTRTFVRQDRHGQIRETHSVAAGLDYPAVGPEHAHLRETGRAEYTSAGDDQALEAFRELSRQEGILPALESAHAVAEVRNRRDDWRGDTVLINLSGRGDKDLSNQEVKSLLQS